MQYMTFRRLAIASLILLGSPAPAFAYMGPGIGLGVAGTAMGVVASLFLVLFAIIWYPLKRLIRRLRRRPAPARPIGRIIKGSDDRPR